MEPLKKNLQLLLFLIGILSLLIINGWILFFNFNRVSSQEAWVTHTYAVVNQIDKTINNVVTAESSARGFLIMRNEEYLSPYHTAVKEYKSNIEAVIALTRDNPEQFQRANKLSKLFEDRFRYLDLVVDIAYKNLRTPVAQLKLPAMGREVMEDIDQTTKDMKTLEFQFLSERSEASERSRSIFLWFLLFTTLLNVIVISFAFLQFKKNQDQSSALARAKAKEAWTREHIGEVARIFSGTASIQDITKELLVFFSEKFGILAAKLFSSEFGHLRLVGAYGTESTEEKKVIHSSLLSEAIKRKELWKVDNIPDTYWNVQSSLGKALPKTILFLPISFQERNIGVIEMASFADLSEDHIQLISQLSETLGVGLNAAQSRENLQNLLQQTQTQAEELQAQQEELKTNNEELEQQARALESQQQAMNVKNRELESMQNALENKAIDLQRSNQYKSEFLAKMSHELRTPLNGLMILSTLLTENKEKNLTEQQKQFAQSINSAGNDLLTLINDILDLSKIEARKLSLRPEKFSASGFLEQLHRTFEPQTSSRGLDFKISQADGLEKISLDTDRQRLEQILRNFLSNSLKFTEKGSIIVKASLVGNDRIQFSVADTGVGIPKNKLDVIFEAFEQADGSVSRKYGGTGLGLTISRELAALLGGEIHLSSEENKGSEFSLIIPIQYKASSIDIQPNVMSSSAKTLEPSTLTKETFFNQVQKADTSVEVKQHVKQALENIDPNKKSILIVEDDEPFRQSAAEVARNHGFQSIEAGRGDVALALLNEFTPHAILMDIKLPEISGLGLLEMIKQMPHLRHVPVHMISAMDYQHNALRMGALGYLTKPVTMEKIRAALDRIENLISEKMRKVLLIEDDEVQSSAVLNLISGTDVKVVPVHTGKDAIEQLKHGAFDCIILDLTLPDVSGFDFLSELNSLEISLPPIVIYTGKDLTQKEEDYLRRFSESIIIKGVRSPERLLDEVNLFLHRVESLLPQEKKEMLTHLRSQEKTFDGRTVLLADDDMRNVFALTSALESKGLKVRIAKNGLEALEAVQKYPDIDLVLMDIMMPKMDGFEAMQRIRDIPAHKKLPIIALTAKAMKEDHERCIAAGANDYLTKPVNLGNLITVLKVWLTEEEF